MARATKPLSPQRLAALARRASDRYLLRDLTLPFAGASRPYSVALPADPDAPLDRFAAVLTNETSESAALHGGQQWTTEPVQSIQERSVTPLCAPQPSASIAAAALSPNTIAADQARRAVASGTHMPYWGLLWPSGLALAEALLSEGNAVCGARALEFGCGLGVTATAALERGISLTAMDCFSEALLFTRYNARRNTGREPRTLLADWRSAEGRAACRAAAPLDALLAADVLYEGEDIAPLLELVPRLLTPDGTFWLAEPGRRVSRLFVEAARVRGWRNEECVYERAWPPDGDVVRVSVHRFERVF